MRSGAGEAWRIMIVPATSFTTLRPSFIDFGQVRLGGLRCRVIHYTRDPRIV